MAKLSAQQLGQNIRELSTFLKEQRQLLPDAAWNNMTTSHHNHLLSQIRALDRITAPEATELTSQVGGLPFSDGLKQELSQEVSAALLRPPKRNAQRDAQEHPTFEYFLSQGDRAMLADPARNLEEKLDVLAVRCVKIGLFYPSETTVGRVVAAAVAIGLAAANHEEFYQRVRRFKAKLKAKRGGVDTSRYALMLPATPDMLPADVLRAAYQDDPVGPPVPASDLARIANDVMTLRKSKKELKMARHGPEQALALPSSSSGGGGGGVGSAAGSGPQANFMQMMSMMMGFMQQHQQQMQQQQLQPQQAGGSGGLNVQFNLPNKRTKALANEAATDSGSGLAVGGGMAGGGAMAGDAGLALVEQTSGSPAGSRTDSQNIDMYASPVGARNDSQNNDDSQTSAAQQASPSTSVLAVPAITAEQQQEWLKQEPADLDAPMKKPAAQPKSAPKAKATPKAANSKAKSKAAPKAAKAKAGKKGSGTSSGGKEVIKHTAKNGWEIHDRMRASGQRDRYYVHEEHGSFRTKGEAVAAGYTD